MAVSSKTVFEVADTVATVVVYNNHNHFFLFFSAGFAFSRIGNDDLEAGGCNRNRKWNRNTNFLSEEKNKMNKKLLFERRLKFIVFETQLQLRSNYGYHYDQPKATTMLKL